MTDEQIIKAFEEVSEDNHMSTINQMICGDALNLIKRLKTENKELRERITHLEKSIDCSRKEYNQLLQKLQQAKSETIKEFAERLCKRRTENDPVVIATKAELDYVLGVGLEESE